MDDDPRTADAPPARPRLHRRSGADRPVSAGDGVRSAHALSFGAHYDPDRTSWGALVAHNDDVLAPGAAYGAHEHRDVEILAWVRSGRMRHTGPDGVSTVAGPGVLQHLVAGTGWHHDEACDGDAPVRMLQLWIAPGLADPPPGPPALTHVPLAPALDAPVSGARARGVPVLAAAGERIPGDPLVRLRRADVSVTVVRLPAGGRFDPALGSTWRHVHVVEGSVTAGEDGGAAEGGGMREGGGAGEGGEAGEEHGEVSVAGDSLEVSGPGPLTLVAGPDGAEVLAVATL